MDRSCARFEEFFSGKAAIAWLERKGKPAARFLVSGKGIQR
jgi:hypothetical protein